MGRTDELLKEAQKRAKARFDSHGIKVQVVPQMLDYGNAGSLTLRFDDKSVCVIQIVAEHVAPGVYLAGVFQWDPQSQALENLIDYIVENYREDSP